MLKIKEKKTKDSNKKSKTDSTRDSKQVNKEIIGIGVMSLGFISLVSLYSDSTGSIGKLIRSTFLKVTGSGAFLLPYIILIIGVLFIANRLRLNENKKIFSLVLMFISILVLADIKQFPSTSDITLYERIVKSANYSSLNKGGGILGALFSYFFLRLFGLMGTYIIITTLILISFLLLTNSSIVTILKRIQEKFSNIYISLKQILGDFIYVDKNEVQESKKNKKISNNPYVENSKGLELSCDQQEEIDQKIKILDYTKESGSDRKEDSSYNQNEEQNDVDIVNKSDNNKCVEEKKISPQKTGDNIIQLNNNQYKTYIHPEIHLLNDKKDQKNTTEKKEILKNAKTLEETLLNFGIEAKIVQISKGPTITRFELQPAPGVKVSRIVNLSDDIALSLAASDVRIEAPIPGKAAVGIEVPNREKINVYLREVLESNEYIESSTKLPFALGKDIGGKPVIASIEKMPHLLIAGATGSGKSVCINTLIMSILFKSTPDEVRLLMIDPKVVELSVYNGIPHLLIPVVTDPKKASGALNWAVQEMTKRYGIFAQNGVRDIFSYNLKQEQNKTDEKLPQIVIIIDELADLMMVSPGEIEDYICRLAQMARAAGIHLIVATQRPSVDVITGTIKANIPSRISFSVSSQADSRTILDMGGAEKLLGKGDMLFHPVGESKPLRLQGAYIDEKEVENVVEFLKAQYSTDYKNEIIDNIESEVSVDVENSDELIGDAIEIVTSEGQASISLLQRRLRIGYARAARLIDEMEDKGIVGGYEGSKPRKVLVSKENLDL